MNNLPRQQSGATYIDLDKELAALKVRLKHGLISYKEFTQQYTEANVNFFAIPHKNKA